MFKTMIDIKGNLLSLKYTLYTSLVCIFTFFATYNAYVLKQWNLDFSKNMNSEFDCFLSFQRLMYLLQWCHVNLKAMPNMKNTRVFTLYLPLLLINLQVNDWLLWRFYMKEMNKLRSQLNFLIKFNDNKTMKCFFGDLCEYKGGDICQIV